MANEEIRIDVDSYSVVTEAIKDLLNSYPGLKGEKIAFGELPESKGKAMFSTGGAVIESERKDILGNVTQACAYRFVVVYRAAGLNEARKMNAEEWLDRLGRWLEGQTIEIDGEAYNLTKYPDLTGKRKFIEIRRASTASLEDISEDMVETWTITINARYLNEYKKGINNG